MKKIIAALVLATALTFSGTAAAEEYLMSPGDQLYIYVQEYPDINGIQPDSNIYQVRPDGNLNFPLVGDIDTTGKTVKEFMAELKERLKEYVNDPTISFDLRKLGTTRVLVLGEVKKAGMYELTKSHRVADALAAAEGYTEKAAKKNIFLIRDGKEETMQKIKLNDFLYKGDTSQNLILKEGDCLFLTSNHKVNFVKDILSLIVGASSAYDNIREGRHY